MLDFCDVAEKRDLHLRTCGPDKLDGDRAMFRGPTSNLLSNAVRHADPGSEVTVALKAKSDKTRVAAENVADDLDAEAPARLFDRFHDADLARCHPGSEGAELRLPITKAIVEAHVGRVEAISAGRGVRFTMRFPG